MRHASKPAILLVSLAICSLLPADSRTTEPAAESNNPVRRALIYTVAEPAGEEAAASTTQAVRSERATRTVRSQPTVTAIRNDEARSEIRIFVEAFVVQVKLPKLYEMGVCPLGSGQGAISAEHVAECLKEGGAEIICGSKLALTRNGKGTVQENQKETTRKTATVRAATTSRRPSAPRDESQSTQRRSTPRSSKPDGETSQPSMPAPTLPSRPPSRPSAVPTTSAARRTSTNTVLRTRSFAAAAEIVRDGIAVDFSYSMTSDDEAQPGEDVASSERTLSWNSSACLKPGRPQIVGATQEGQQAVFLILTANVED